MNKLMFQKWIAVLVLLLLSVGLCACSGQKDALAPVELLQGNIAAETAAPAQTDLPTVPAETAAPPAAPTVEPKEEPVPTGPDLPVCGKVDDDFFGNTAFFGNSLVDGLRLFGGLKCGEFYAVQSASVINIGMTKNTVLSDGTPATLLDALCEKPHDKIYILLGINEIGFDKDYFISLYSGMMDTIEAREPGAEIYIMSLTPVTRTKSDEGWLFCEDHVLEYNEALYAFAQERGYWYVDLVEALAGPDGYLPAEQSSDGIHLNVDKYSQWADYLRTHCAAEFKN